MSEYVTELSVVWIVANASHRRKHFSGSTTGIA